MSATCTWQSSQRDLWARLHHRKYDLDLTWEAVARQAGVSADSIAGLMTRAVSYKTVFALGAWLRATDSQVPQLELRISAEIR